jgi:hypothetical protein
MAYSAHIYKKKVVDFDQATFSGEADQLEKYFKKNLPPYSVCVYYNDGSEEWEIERESLIALVNNLKENYYPEEPVFGNYSAMELIERFEGWLNTTSNPEDFSNPEWIYIAWF